MKPRSAVVLKLSAAGAGEPQTGIPLEGLQWCRKRSCWHVSAARRHRPPVRAARWNEAWAMDFVAGRLHRRSKLRVFTVIDAYTHEYLAAAVAFGMGAAGGGGNSGTAPAPQRCNQTHLLRSRQQVCWAIHGPAGISAPSQLDVQPSRHTD